MTMDRLDTIVFLELYKLERILWDRQDPDYHDIHKRLKARERIAKELELNVEKVGEIFNRLRCGYVEETRKMSEDDNYYPTMIGFQTMTTIMKQLSTNMAEEDVPCDVCKSTEGETNNQMIFCDKCNVCVHQVCYGVEKIPEGSWYCKPCALNIQPFCIFCLQGNGAMKSTSNGKWAHISCTLWIPEVSFANPEKMEDIIKFEKIPKTRWALCCVICRKRGGACIQCYVPKCKTAYHVSCAYRIGLHMEMEDVESSDSEVRFESFCKTHTLKKRTSVDQPLMRKTKIANKDETFAQTLSSAENHASSSADVSINVPLTDVSYVESTTVDNGNEAQSVENETEVSHKVPPRTFIEAFVRKATARKSFPVTGRKIHKKKRLGDILPTLPKTVNSNKSRGRLKVPNVQTKRKANQSSTTKPAELEPVPSSLNHPGKSRKKPKLDEQEQSNKTPQNVPTPNLTASAIRVLFPPPENQQTPTEMQSEHGLSPENDPQTLSNNHPPSRTGNQSPPINHLPSGSGDRSPPMQRGNQTPFASTYHPPSTATGLQEIPTNDQLTSFLGYLESLLRSLPPKKALKIQPKLISRVFKEHGAASSSDELSDVSSISD